MDGETTAGGPEDPQCSARGCRNDARWTLVWANPRIHGTERTKTWLACDDHREYLSDFLDRRSFLREVVAFTPEP
ncbi:MAG TPA: hypothetical protein VGL93_17560 [Streptosporangiaceae bacterium]